MVAIALAWVLLSGTSPLPTAPPPSGEPAFAEAMGPYRGRPVLAIDVKAPPGNDPEELRALIDIQPGYLLGQTDIESAVKRLYALGRFSQVSVYAERMSGVVVLHFQVDPLRRLAGISFEGNGAVSTKALERAAGIGPGDEVDSRTEARLRDRLLKYLDKEGYPRATVMVERNAETEPGLVPFIITVDEGPAVLVRSIRFEGPKRVPEPLLRDWMRLEEGNPFSRNDLQHDRDTLREQFVERGFLRAVVGEPTVVEDGLWADVTFNIAAGDRIDVQFVGNTVFSDTTLRQLWPEPGGAIGRGTLRIFQSRIASAYQRQGHPRAGVKMRGFRDAEAGITRYLYEIDEGVPTEVGIIRFPGAQAFPADVLSEQVRASLRRDLPSDPFFQPLTPINKRASLLVDEPPGPPPKVEPEDRWVPDVYQQAADQIAAAYRDVGFLAVDVDTPRPRAADGEPPACLAQPNQTERCSFDVEIAVNEGPQSFVNSVGFTGNQAFAASELLDVVYAITSERPLGAPLAPGGPFSVSGIEDGRIELIRHYRDQGYLYVRVFSDVRMRPDGQWADITYSVEEGPQVRVQRVLVRGNRFTRESIIRSRITFKPGDLYRLEQAVGDQRSIASLGVFSNVRVKLIDEEHPTERKDLVADVLERNRQAIELIPGISSANGPRVRTTYAYLNVFGTATSFNANLKLNRQIFFSLFDQYAATLEERYNSYVGTEQITKALERQIRLGLRSPPLKQLPFDPVLRLDLVEQRVNRVNYSLETAAAIFGIDAFLGSRRVRMSLDTQFGFTNLECPLPPVTITDAHGNVIANQDCSNDADLHHLQGGAPIEVGQRYTFKVGPFITFDWRDNPLNPSRGVFASVRLNQAIGEARPNEDALYVPFSFFKYEGNITGYAPLWGTVLALSLRGGSVNVQESGVPLDERFFLGGRDTVRGFVEGTLIPQDVCIVPITTPAGTPPPRGCSGTLQPSVLENGQLGPPLSQGGNTYLLFKTELRIPLREQLSIDLFCDLGNLWLAFIPQQNFALRIGTGIGLRYGTPVGALAVDLGINPEARAVNGEPITQIHFSIGSF